MRIYRILFGGIFAAFIMSLVNLATGSLAFTVTSFLSLFRPSEVFPFALGFVGYALIFLFGIVGLAGIAFRVAPFFKRLEARHHEFFNPSSGYLPWLEIPIGLLLIALPASLGFMYLLLLASPFF